MAWQYTAVCLFDFIIAPILTAIYYKWSGGTYVPWVPLTLKEGGFYHMSMMGIVGVSAWSRGQENLATLQLQKPTTEDTTKS